ncbi:MAG: restriction endonuclease subunit S [Campylobacter sp.]|nr:restriction endonuclease subunit S [Campylobacter sp.]
MKSEYKYRLEDVEWGEFALNDFFDFELSAGDNQAKLLNDGKIPLVSSGTNNNGICKFILDGDGISKIFDKDLITIDMFGKVFYHKYKFYAVSHGRINILVSKIKLSSYIKKFLANTIEYSIKDVFSYNRMCSQKRLHTIKFKLPIDNQGNPNWYFMEEFIKEREAKQRKILKEYYTNRLLDLAISPEILTDV